VELDHNKKTTEARFFRDVKMTKTQFEIRHFAGIVRYESVGFLEKNKDKLHDNLEQLLMESSDQYFKAIMERNVNKALEPTGGKSDEPSVSRQRFDGRIACTLATRFQLQLSELVEILNGSDAHFVRCIKPNSGKNPNEIESGLVVRQLQYSGVLEAIQIRKNGYPIRRTLADFRKSYWMLSGFTRFELATEDERMKCSKIVQGLSLKNSLYNDIHVGRTIVFFRPEVLQALEQDRLAKGVRGIIYAQSKHRKVKAQQRVHQLLQSRSELRRLLASGMLNGSTNCDVLNELRDHTKHCHLCLKLVCVEMASGSRLIKRLEDVLDCKNQVARLLSSTSSDHYKDVLMEYQSVTNCMTKVSDLRLTLENYGELEARRELLRERAEALKFLRTSVERFDDGTIITALGAISVLTAKYGAFCIDDEATAKSRLDQITFEVGILRIATDVIVRFQHEYKAKQKELTSAQQGTIEIRTWGWLSENIARVNESLSKSLVSFELRPVISPLGKQILAMVTTVGGVRTDWLNRQWHKIASSVESLLLQCREGESSDYASTMSLVAVKDDLVHAVRNEVALLRDELDKNVVLPMISSGIGTGRLFMENNDIVVVESIDAEPLFNLIEHVTELEWVGVAVRTLIGRVRVLADARQAVIDERWSDAIAGSETRQQTEVRRRRLLKFCEAIEAMFHLESGADVGWEGGTDIKLMSDPTLVKVDVEQSLTVVLDGVFAVESQKIEDEMKAIHRFSTENYVLELVRAAASLGGIATDNIDISCTLHRLNYDGLLLSTTEASIMFKNCSGFRPIYISFVEILVATRRSAILKDWAGVLTALGSSEGLSLTTEEFDVLIGKESKWSQRLLYAIREEICRICVYAKNLVALEKMMAALPVGRIEGTPGSLSLLSCSCSGIQQAVIQSQECSAGDISGLLEEVERTTKFSKSVIDLRNAFLANKPLVSCLTVASDAYEAQKMCRSLPPDSVNEIMLVQNHVLLCRSKELLMEELRRRPPVSYIVPSANRMNDRNEIKEEYDPDMDSRSILDEEGFILNEDVLNTAGLSEGLQLAIQLQNLVPTVSLPEEYTSLVSLGTIIKSLRDAVSACSWELASKTLADIRFQNLESKFPFISEEILGSEQPINSYLLVAECKSALSSGHLTGPIGTMDPSGIVLDKLDRAIGLCQRIGCKTIRTETLFKAVLAISDLRKAQLAHDWGTVKMVLHRTELENLGTGLTASCTAELQRAKIERDNYDAVSGIKRSLLAEEIKAEDGKIDSNKIVTEKLSAAVLQCVSLAPHKRGDITNAMVQLGETTLKFRRAVSLQQAFTVHTFIEPLRQDMEALTSAIESSEAGMKKSRSLREINSLVSPSRGAEGDGLIRGSMFLWDFYSEVFELMNREISTVEHHFAATDLENNISKALQENGMTTAMIGLSDWSKIRVDDLRAAIDSKRRFDAEMKPLPHAVHNLFKVAHLIFEMRSAIVSNIYEALSPLIEESVTLLKHMPEFSRAEVEAVRYELENRWIITNMTEALRQGRLEGSVGGVRLSGVAYEHLETAVKDYKGMNPRTEEAKRLVLTAETILPLRKLLCETPVLWKPVKQLVSEMLSTSVASTLHESVLVELRLIQSTADDYILFNMMEAALKRGGPSGEPGFLNLDYVDVVEIRTACEAVMETPVKTERTQQLWTACRHVKNLRDALLRSSSNDEQAVSEAFRTVSAVIKDVFDARRGNLNDLAWNLCRDEVNLVRKTSCLNEIREMIEEAIKRASRVYENRSKMSVAQGGRRSISTAVGDIILSCEELQDAVKKAGQLDFTCDLLEKYISCAKTLCDFRSALLSEEWSRLNDLVSNLRALQSLEAIPSALQELSCVKQESHNYQVIDIIERALQPRSKDDVDNEHLYLVRAIEAAQTTVVTSVTAKQLLECSKNVLLLRVGLNQQDSKAVGTALRWFKLYSHQCPSFVQQEFQRAYIMHQNVSIGVVSFLFSATDLAIVQDLLLTGLTDALTTGAASGIRGNMDLTTIDVTNLSGLLEQARSLKHQTVPVRELIEAAEVIYSLRCAMKNNDSVGVMAALDLLSAKKSIPDIILEEIAVARTEVENCLTISALYEGLSAFDDTNPKSLELSLVGTQSFVANLNSAGMKAATKNSPEPSAMKSAGSQRRRYSYENISSSDIDPDTISISELDEALDVSKEHGVLTDQARRLLRTTLLVKSLRTAMKFGDWLRVQEILAESNFNKGVGDVYDHVAWREIQVIQYQLEMRKSVVDLAAALKHGWANCSNGIVDTSTVSTTELNFAIERAEKSMVELGHPPSAIPLTDDLSQFQNLSASVSRDMDRVKERALSSTTPLSSSWSANRRRPSIETTSKSATQSQVELLLSSARIVAEVRECLARRELDKAGVLSDEGIRSNILHSSVVPELKLYSIEINRALGMMKLCQALREGMAEGDLDVLEPLIVEARKASMQLSNDLGLVRTLEKAQLVYKSFLACRKALVKLSNNYHVKDVQQTIDNAVAINISGYLIQNARTRLARLKEYESSVHNLRRANGGALVDEQACKAVVDLGMTYGMKHHPWTRRAEIALRLSSAAMRTSVLLDAVANNKPYVAATETMKLKRSFLLLPSSKVTYSLEQFPRLRKKEDFFFRVSNNLKVASVTTLMHTDENITTSITTLDYYLAALSVWIFSQCIQGIEKQLYTRPEVLLRNLIIVGRNCVMIRDEILLQIVKQIRGNPHVLNRNRLWNMLATCLHHFPPSQSLENYLELFLILEFEDLPKSAPNMATDSGLTAALVVRICQRLLHESVFKYGYFNPIISKCDLSLKTVLNWLLYASPTENSTRTALVAGVQIPLISAQFMRGTRSNWIERFNLFIGGERFANSTQKEVFAAGGINSSSKPDDASSRSRMTVSLFVDAVSSFNSPAAVDRMDRELLQFLVFGRHPEHKTKIAREYYSDKASFAYLSDAERVLSAERRCWLRSVFMHLTVPSAAPAKAAERKVLAAEFWEKYLDRMSTEFEGTLSSKELGGKVIKKITTVTKASFTTVTWELYREIVLTAMEIHLESEHNSLHQASASSMPVVGPHLTSRPTGEGGRNTSCYDGFEMYTVDTDTGEIRALLEDDGSDMQTEDNGAEQGEK
jgi:hypothetical protein